MLLVSPGWKVPRSCDVVRGLASGNRTLPKVVPEV